MYEKSKACTCVQKHSYKVLGRSNSLSSQCQQSKFYISYKSESVRLYKKVKSVYTCVQKAPLQGAGQGQHPPSVIPFKEMLGEGGAWQPTHKRLSGREGKHIKIYLF